jgi:hypothetical protein
MSPFSLLSRSLIEPVGVGEAKKKRERKRAYVNCACESPMFGVGN